MINPTLQSRLRQATGADLVVRAARLIENEIGDPHRGWASLTDAEIRSYRFAARAVLALGMEEARQIMRDEWASGPGSVAGYDVTFAQLQLAFHRAWNRMHECAASLKGAPENE